MNANQNKYREISLKLPYRIRDKNFSLSLRGEWMQALSLVRNHHTLNTVRLLLLGIHPENYMILTKKHKKQ